MGAVEVAGGVVDYRSRDEAREVIERTFERVEGDERLAPVLRAADLRERLRITDRDLAVTLASGDGARCLEWGFSVLADRSSFEPRISLTMESAVANAVLQGAESIGVAIARRRIRLEGDAAAALVHLPATRAIREHYTDLIAREYPHLLVGVAGVVAANRKLGVG